eukprot:843081-Prymnesium_polylepis.1
MPSHKLCSHGPQRRASLHVNGKNEACCPHPFNPRPGSAHLAASRPASQLQPTRQGGERVFRCSHS